MSLRASVWRCSTAFALMSGCWSEIGPLGNDNDGICPDADCVDSVTVDVSRRDEQAFTPGDYEFSVEIESGNPIAATCALSNEATLSCGGSTRIVVRMNDDFDTFTLRIDNTAPEQLFMAVYKDDVEIGEDILTPNYEYIVGDDPDCIETCVQGNVDMRVSSGS